MSAKDITKIISKFIFGFLFYIQCEQRSFSLPILIAFGLTSPKAVVKKTLITGSANKKRETIFPQKNPKPIKPSKNKFNLLLSHYVLLP